MLYDHSHTTICVEPHLEIFKATIRQYSGKTRPF